MYHHLETFAIGGLFNVGYQSKSDVLIVLSSQGSGIFNCLTAQKIYRDDKDWYEDLDQSNSSINAIGPYLTERVTVYGVNNPVNLPSTKFGDWELIITAPQPEKPPFERFKVQKVSLKNSLTGEEIFVTQDGPCEMRAFGFSDTGNSFVVALSCELTIWGLVNSFDPISKIKL